MAHIYHVPEQEKQRCHICGQYEYLEVHILECKDSEENSQNYKCDICEKVFTGHHSNLLQHIKFVHDKIQSYQCQLCSRAFKHYGHLKRHMLNVHKTNLMYKCDICNEVFSKSKNLKEHNIKIHEALPKCET